MTGRRKRWLAVLALVGIMVALAGSYIHAFWGLYLSDPPAASLPVPNTKLERPTTSGRVVGFERDGVDTWLGIPYATAARWRAPAPPDAWQGVRLATQRGNICPQFQRSGIGAMQLGIPRKEWGNVIGSEDCLNLNIRAPHAEGSPAGAKLLPVMVYVHAGYNTIGYAEMYDFSRFVAQEQVVVVSVNYRLGILGWFNHPAVQELSVDPAERSGDFALLDVIAALHWVQKNVAAFGGDPDNVTLNGLSAGGSNVLALLTAPAAKGLFGKAIIQSGGIWYQTPEEARNYRDAPVPGQDNSAREFVNQLLIARGKARTRAEAIVVQNSMSPQQLQGLLQGSTTDELFAPMRTGDLSGVYRWPSIMLDGGLLPAEPLVNVLYHPERYNAVPLLIGSANDDAKFYMAFNPRFVKSLPTTQPRDPVTYDRIARYASDSWRALTVDDIVRRIYSGHGAPTFSYRFDWEEHYSGMLGGVRQLISAAHGLELAFVSGQFQDYYGLRFLFRRSPNPVSRDALSRDMMSYWAQFIYSGDPGKGRDDRLPAWPAWNPQQSAKFIIFDTPARGGIRMADGELTSETLKHALADDNALNQQLRCNLYVWMFYHYPANAPWSDNEYQTLSQRGCATPPGQATPLAML